MSYSISVLSLSSKIIPNLKSNFMNTDKEKLEWIAEHMTGFHMGIGKNVAQLSYIDDYGFPKAVSVCTEEESAPFELLNLALEKAMA